MSIQVENRVHFGLSIFEAQLELTEDRRQAIIQALNELRARDHAGLTRSNQRGWHSSDNLHTPAITDQYPALKWLTEEIYQLGCQLIRHADQTQQDQPILLTSLWANINDTGAWNAPHSHMPCEWSGCIYINVNENVEVGENGIADGDIMFFNPMPLGPQYKSPTTINYSPKNGKLFMFPGHLVHMVAPHYDEEPRISMAFNFRLQQNTAN